MLNALKYFTHMHYHEQNKQYSNFSKSCSITQAQLHPPFDAGEEAETVCLLQQRALLGSIDVLAPDIEKVRVLVLRDDYTVLVSI
jgi:hypothetical protein